jgi:hypothetical protein
VALARTGADGVQSGLSSAHIDDVVEQRDVDAARSHVSHDQNLAPRPSPCRCGTGEPSRGADVAGVSPVPVQMWDTLHTPLRNLATLIFRADMSILPYTIATCGRAFAPCRVPAQMWQR